MATCIPGCQQTPGFWGVTQKIYINRPKGLQWAPSSVLALVADVDYPVF